jgi:DNA-binding IclR family transcriptional regulator
MSAARRTAPDDSGPPPDPLAGPGPGPRSRPAGPGGESIAAVDRALDVLLLLGAAGRTDVGVTEISTELSLSKAATHRILTSLRSRELVVLDPRSRRYHLGPAALGLGRAYLDRIDLRTLASSELTWLAARADETAALSVRAGSGRMYVDQVAPDREVRTEVVLGTPLPLRVGATGRAFLAFLPADEMEALLGGDAARGNAGPGPSASDLARVSKAGYAVGTDDDTGGIATLAAPVLDYDRHPAGVLSLCGPSDRLLARVEYGGLLLLQAAGRLSRRLGGPATEAPARSARP